MDHMLDGDRDQISSPRSGFLMVPLPQGAKSGFHRESLHVPCAYLVEADELQ